LKVKVYVSGWITEPDGTVKDVLVCEREDGERLETVLAAPYNFDVKSEKLIAEIKKKPKHVAPQVKEVEVE